MKCTLCEEDSNAKYCDKCSSFLDGQTLNTNRIYCYSIYCKNNIYFIYDGRRLYREEKIPGKVFYNFTYNLNDSFKKVSVKEFFAKRVIGI